MRNKLLIVSFITLLMIILPVTLSASETSGQWDTRGNPYEWCSGSGDNGVYNFSTYAYGGSYPDFPVHLNSLPVGVGIKSASIKILAKTSGGWTAIYFSSPYGGSASVDIWGDWDYYEGIDITNVIRSYFSRGVHDFGLMISANQFSRIACNSNSGVYVYTSPSINYVYTTRPNNPTVLLPLNQKYSGAMPIRVMATSPDNLNLKLVAEYSTPSNATWRSAATSPYFPSGGTYTQNWNIGGMNFDGDSTVFLRVKVEDANGGYSEWQTVTTQVNSSPSLNLTTPDNTLVLKAGDNLAITGTVQDTDVGDTLTMKYSISGVPAHNGITLGTITANGAPQAFSYNVTIDGTIPQGNYTLTVWAEDDKGGISQNITRSFLVDKTPPGASIVLNNGDAQVYEGESPVGPTLDYSVSGVAGLSGLDKFWISNYADFHDYEEYSFAGGSPVTGTFTALNDVEASSRTKTVYVRVFSMVGLSADAADDIYRNAIPTVADLVIAPKLAAAYPSITWTNGDADGDSITGSEVRVTSGLLAYDQTFPVAGAAGSWTYDPAMMGGALADGAYTVTVRNQDQYGAWSDWSDTANFVMDTGIIGKVVVDPALQPDPAVPSATGGQFTYETLKSMDNTVLIKDNMGATVRSLGQGIQTAGTYPVTWDGNNDLGQPVPDGTYDAVLSSFDGGVTITTDLGSITLDREDPSMTIIKPAGIYHKAAVEIQISSADNILLGAGTVKVFDAGSVELASWATVAGAYSGTYMPPADGSYTLQATQTDAAGNTTTETYAFVYDTTEPGLSVLYPTDTQENPPQLVITVTDPNANKVYLNATELAGTFLNPSTLRATATVTLNPGANSYTVRATDFAGNFTENAFSINYTPPAPSGGGGEMMAGPVSVVTAPTADLGLPKDVKVIDLRLIPEDSGKVQESADGLATVASVTTATTTVEFLINRSDLAQIDPKKAKNYDQVKNIFETELAPQLAIEYRLYEDAVGLYAVVIGKDGSVNYLNIDIPFLTRYIIPDGEDISQWGVYQYNETAKAWQMVPSFPDGIVTLAARTSTGVYKAMKMTPVEFTDVQPDNWVYNDLQKMGNIGAIPAVSGTKFEPAKSVTLNEVLNMAGRIAQSQKFPDLVALVDDLNLNKELLTRSEFVALMNAIVDTDLQVTLVNRPGSVEYSQIISFALNTNPDKLANYRDADMIMAGYLSDMAMAVNYGFVVGKEGYILDPNEYISRAEAISIMCRYAYFAGHAKYKLLNV